MYISNSSNFPYRLSYFQLACMGTALLLKMGGQLSGIICREFDRLCQILA